MSKQLANFALQLVNTAPTRGADAENVASLKQWLREIEAGRLVVGAPVPPKVRKKPTELTT
jgi:hypothetical protein